MLEPVTFKSATEGAGEIQNTCIELPVGDTLFEITLIVIVVVVAHCPAVGVKVYVVVAVLFYAGDQVPFIPLFEFVGKALRVVPKQIGVIGLKIGVINGSTVMVIVWLEAHCPAVGVKV